MNEAQWAKMLVSDGCLFLEHAVTAPSHVPDPLLYARAYLSCRICGSVNLDDLSPQVQVADEAQDG